MDLFREVTERQKYRNYTMVCLKFFLFLYFVFFRSYLTFKSF